MASSYRRLSFEVANARRIIALPPGSGEPTLQVIYYNWLKQEKIDRFYSFGRPEPRTVDPLWIVSQLIHSFVYMSEAEDGPPLGLYFNSDNSRHESLSTLRGRSSFE